MNNATIPASTSKLPSKSTASTLIIDQKNALLTAATAGADKALHYKYFITHVHTSISQIIV